MRIEACIIHYVLVYSLVFMQFIKRATKIEMGTNRAGNDTSTVEAWIERMGTQNQNQTETRPPNSLRTGCVSHD